MPRPKGSKNKPKQPQKRNFVEDIKYAFLCLSFLGGLAIFTFALVLIKGRAFTRNQLRLLFKK